MVDVFFNNADNSEKINLNADRIDMRIVREPLIYGRANKTEPKMRDLKKMTKLFIVTATIANNYDIDGNAGLETPWQQKKHIEDSMKDWTAVGNRSHQFTWYDTTYTGLITKVDITEVGGEQNQYQVMIEFQEGTF